jgi:riboflavin synthase
MFTGIVQGVATLASIVELTGLRRLTLAFPEASFTHELAVGASVAVDGVCLTVTQLLDARHAAFDVMQQSLQLTTLGARVAGDRVNVERAAKANAEVGGHPLSGHVDFRAQVQAVRSPENNRVLRMAVPAPWMRYLFAKGYVAVQGASLTIAEAHRESDGSGWFEVWLIPETLRMTTFGDTAVGDALNIEIDRSTQVIVDTVRDAVDARLGRLVPLLEEWLQSRGLSMDDLHRSK